MTKTLDVELLDLYYSNWLPKLEGPQEKFWYAKLHLLDYYEYDHTVEYPLHPELNFNRGMTVRPVYGPIRKKFRNILTTEILPKLRKFQGKYRKISVYYVNHNDATYDALERGGIYIVDENKNRVLYRSKDFNIDEELKECLK